MPRAFVMPGYKFLFAPLLCLSTVAYANGLPSRPSLPLPHVKVAPSIDGDLSDPAWKEAFAAPEFFRFGSNTPIEEKTEAWLCADENYLYAAFKCYDSHPELERASETQRGSQSVWNDDHVTVIVDSQNTRRGTSSFGVNPIGTQVEFLEGGTADNIAWAGDWKAAVKRFEGGHIVEVAIPFALLRYPKGATSMGIMLNRQLNRERNPVAWPNIPPEGQTFQNRVQFIPEFTGMKLPTLAARPTILPFTLASTGDGSKARTGLDVKYPVSTTLTGVLAIKPDFQTIENDVAGINFSYNEQYVPDRRPFFAEGNEFFPNTDLFYSRRLGVLDDGLKLVGKDGNRAIGILRAHTEGPEGRESNIINLRQGVGALSQYGFSAVDDRQAGQPGARLARLFGDLGQSSGDRQNVLSVSHAQSWLDDQPQGVDTRFDLRSRGAQGKARYRLSWEQLDSDFVSPLGLLYDQNRKGLSASMSWHNQLDKGPLGVYDINLDARKFDRQTDGSFFLEDTNLNVYGETMRGIGLGIGYNSGRRRNDPTLPDIFHDRSVGMNLSWNRRTLFSQGNIGYRTGRQAGQNLRSWGGSQGILISRPFSLQGNYSEQRLGVETTRQAIVTGTYRLSPYKAISGRLVSRNGTGNDQNVGPSKGTNFYFAYSQRTRGGADLFVLLGDPNAADTRGTVTVKLLRAL
ncbi:MAG: DUF5916 domain-containing protein [Armatimonas sp.]